MLRRRAVPGSFEEVDEFLMAVPLHVAADESAVEDVETRDDAVVPWRL
jgi:hypothetical protein